MDFCLAFFFNFVDTDDGMERDVSPLDPCELAFEFLIGRIHHDFCPLAEGDITHFNESVHSALRHLMGVDLVNASLIMEDNAEDILRCHRI